MHAVDELISLYLSSTWFLKVGELQPQSSLELIKIMEHRLSAIEHRSVYLQGIINQVRALESHYICLKLGDAIHL